MSKKKKDLFDNVIDTGLVGIGTTTTIGMTSKLNQMYPNPVSGKINKSMQPMTILPTMSATGGVFGQLQNLDKKVKKRR